MAETGGGSSSSAPEQLQTTSAYLPSLSQLPRDRLSAEDIVQIIAAVGGQLCPMSSQQTNPISAGEGLSNVATSSSIITYLNAGKICVGGDVASHYV